MGLKEQRKKETVDQLGVTSKQSEIFTEGQISHVFLNILTLMSRAEFIEERRGTDLAENYLL